MATLSCGLKNSEIKTPRDHYRKLRDLWTKKEFEEEERENLLRHPFAKIFPLSRVLCALVCPEREFFEEELSLEEMQIACLPHKMLWAAEICQLILLKIIKGEKKSAHALIDQAAPWIAFPTLWAAEEIYDPLEFYFSAYLLYSYIGAEKLAALCKMATLGAKSPFFSKLEESLSLHVGLKDFSLADRVGFSSLGTWAHGGFAASLSGCGTSLGVFQQGEVEIRALGPQFYPLTDLGQFGVRGIHQPTLLEEGRIAGWTCCFAEPHIWLFAEAFSQARLHVRWVGLTAEKKGFFVFYVKAKTAHIGRQVFFSKSLQRYKAVADSIRFNEETLVISSREPRQLELIPLAGDQGFWGADFLVAFEMFPFDSEEWFSFKTPAKGLL